MASASAITLLWTFHAFIGVPSPETITPERWQTEFYPQAIQAWEDYRRLVAQVQGKSRHRIRSLSQEGSLREELVEWEFQQDGANTRVITRYSNTSDELPAEKAVVVNPRYAFEAQKAKTTASWVLTRLDLNLYDGRGIDPSARRAVLEESCLLLLSIKGRLLPQILDSPACLVAQASVVHQDGSKLIRVAFSDATPVPEEQGGWRSMEGWVLLDPDHLWVINQCSVQGILLGDVRCQVTMANTYEKTDSGCVIPTERIRTVTYRFEESSRSETWESEFLWNDTEKPPLREFTLSAFGLPEPPGVTWERPTPWWLYGLGLGLALVILSGILLKVAQRWRSRAAASGK